MRRLPWLLALFVAASSCTHALPAAAHPLGNFTINHLAKVSLDRDGVTVRYIVDLAEIPTFQIMVEHNIRGTARAHELARWGLDETSFLTRGLTVQADGRIVSLHAAKPVVSTRPGAGGLPTLYFVDVLRGRFSAASPRILRIVDNNYALRIGWKDIVVAPQSEPTHELRAYPKELLQSPRSVSAIQLRLGPELRIVRQDTVTAAEAAAPAGSTSQVRSNLLSDMLAKGHAQWSIVLVTLLVAIGLGALHALEPGHGKTLLAVSLVGARATPKQALLLAIALTVAHTCGVLALGVALLVLAQFMVPESVYPWITLASGVLVAVLGGSSLARWIKVRRGLAHEHDHDHAHGGHGHEHRSSVLAQSDTRISFRNVVLIAASGNVAPCPAALVVLLTALAIHQVGYGLVVVVAFSVGLAAVLTSLGIAVVRGASWLGRWPGFDRISAYSPVVTAVIIATIGVVMVARAAPSIADVSSLLVASLVVTAILAYALSPGHVHSPVHKLESP